MESDPSKSTNHQNTMNLAPLFGSPQSHSLRFKLFNIPFFLLVIPPIFLCSSATAEEVVRKIRTSFNISVPDTARFNPQGEEYVCTVKRLNLTEKAFYLEEFVYLFSKNGSAHHFLLYGCKSVAKYALDNTYWPCNAPGKGSLCSKRKHIPLGIPQKTSRRNPKFNVDTPTKFPENVAYGVGPQFEINYLMLEVHFMPVKRSRGHGTTGTGAGENRNRSRSTIQSKKNSASSSVQRSYSSGVVAHGSNSRPSYLAGMMVMAGVGFVIPRGEKNFSVEVNCQPELSQPIYPYAYWVHTHDLGQMVSGYRVSRTSGEFTEIARWSHRRPQPVILDPELSKSTLAIFPGDIMAGKCIYDSSNSTADVHWGPRHGFKEISTRFPHEAYVLPPVVSSALSTLAGQMQ